MNTKQIADILVEQGCKLHNLGIRILAESETVEGRKQTQRRIDAVGLLKASRTSLVEAARLMVPMEEIMERERLLRLAFENGYEIALESDGRITLEKMELGYVPARVLLPE